MSTDGYIACAVDLSHRVDPNDTTPAAIHMSVWSPYTANRDARAPVTTVESIN